MEITGTIKALHEEQQVSATFKKREVVIETDEQYKQLILIEFSQDKCDLLNYYKEGQEVKVSINLRGRSWVNPQGETKYFNSIQGWRIEKLNQETSTPQKPKFEPTPEFKEEDHDDLPF